MNEEIIKLILNTDQLTDEQKTKIIIAIVTKDTTTTYVPYYPWTYSTLDQGVQRITEEPSTGEPSINPH